MPPPGRPISSLSPTFSKMGDAALKANVEAVERSTKKLGAVVQAQGSRHRIKGRSGKRVPLSSKTDVRAFAQAGGKLVVTGAVRGIPEGFWRIVEDGSAPHLMTTRGNRVTRSGRSVSGRYTKTQTLRKFGEGHGFGDLKPLSNRAAGGTLIAQWVMHPGHGSQGKPWDAAMSIGAPLVANEMKLEESRALFKAFVKSI